MSFYEYHFKANEVKIQQYEMTEEKISDINHTITFRSIQKTKEVACPCCGGEVEIYDHSIKTLKDMPFFIEGHNTIKVDSHRYECKCCKKTFTEKNPFQYPGTRVTHRVANWIQVMIRVGCTIEAIHTLTGVHWGTIKNIHKDIMAQALIDREKDIQKTGYKPKHLAVDEFSIHKGHTYATCVMDLDNGEIIWVGKGRAIADFRKFFQEIDMAYLSEVEAVAMDMNASYNKLVEQYLPKAVIVYDRYHFQAQYGKEVLGVERLNAARNHNQEAKKLRDQAKGCDDLVQRKTLKQEAKEESKLYSKLKSSRWTILRNPRNVKDDEKRQNLMDSLSEILSCHQILATCYAMKEEMIEIYSLNDISEAEIRWSRWFDAAKNSEIESLTKFAKNKEKRIPGLITHAMYAISTGKLEGLNNKIKVAKRIAYGYRDDDYFFMLIRYSSLPSFRSPRFP